MPSESIGTSNTTEAIASGEAEASEETVAAVAVADEPVVNDDVGGFQKPRGA